MNIHNVEHLLRSAASLTPSERLLLASRLIQSVRNEMPPHTQQINWKDVAGLLPYPALGEDAQLYISHLRRTDDHHRYLVVRDGE